MIKISDHYSATERERLKWRLHELRAIHVKRLAPWLIGAIVIHFLQTLAVLVGWLDANKYFWCLVASLALVFLVLSRVMYVSCFKYEIKDE